MKIFKRIFLGFWAFIVLLLAYCTITNYQNLRIIDLFMIILFASFPYLILLIKHRKKKKSVTNNSITDAEVPYLIQSEYEESLATQSIPVRTKKERELAFNFEMNHFDKYSELEFKLMDLELKAKQENNLSEKIQLLEKTIAAYEKLKRFCYSKGKGGTIFFQDEWESKPFLSDIQEELEETKHQRDTIASDILDGIQESEGISQKRLYTLFPELSTSEIQFIIKKLEGDGSIKRIKKNNSYELHINNN